MRARGSQYILIILLQNDNLHSWTLNQKQIFLCTNVKKNKKLKLSPLKMFDFFFTSTSE